MNDHRCPSCSNDLTEQVITAIVDNISVGSREAEPLSCPYCGESLMVDIAIRATLLRQSAPAFVS